MKKSVEPNLPSNSQNVFVMKKKCKKCDESKCMCGKRKLKVKRNNSTEKSLLVKSNGKKRNYEIGETSQTTGKKKVAPGKWVDPKTGKTSSSEGKPAKEMPKKEPAGKPKGKGEKPKVSPETEAKIREIAKKRGIEVTKQFIESVTDEMAGGNAEKRAEGAAKGAEGTAKQISDTTQKEQQSQPQEDAGAEGKTDIDLKNHKNYNKSDYDALSKKGYTDKEIAKVWDADATRGISGGTEQKKAPDDVGTATGTQKQKTTVKKKSPKKKTVVKKDSSGKSVEKKKITEKLNAAIEYRNKQDVGSKEYDKHSEEITNLKNKLVRLSKKK